MSENGYEAGAAAAILPLDAGLPLGGYLADARNAAAPNSSLSVRAVVLASGGVRVAIVVFDLLYAGAGLTSRLRGLLEERLGMPAHRVLVAGTHTHCGPRDITLESGPELVEALADAGFGVVEEAVSRLAPVRVLSDVVGGLGIGRSRRDPDAPVDHDAHLVVLQATDGAIVATLVDLACHPVVLDPAWRQYDPDFIGPLRSLVEDATGGVCVYLQGFAGDVNPVRVESSAREAKRVGLSAAGTIVGRIAEITATGREAGVINLSLDAVVPVPLRQAATHSGALTAASTVVHAIRRRGAVVRGPDATPTAIAMEEWITGLRRERNRVFNSMELGEASDGDITLEVQVIGFGDTLRLVAFPGEPLGALRAGVTARFPDAHVLTVGYANGAPGYLPDSAAFAESGYEVGCSIVAPDTAERLIAAIPDPAASAS
ncbi:hypothetical protein GCM10028798_13350 [Humibacter antri]